MRSTIDRARASLAHLQYLPRSLMLIWSATHRWTIAWAVLLVCNGLVPAAIVYLSRPLVDQLILATSSKGAWNDLRPTLLLAGTIISLMALAEVVQGAVDWVRSAQAELVQDYMSQLIHTQSVSVDLSFYETPEYHDRLYQARDEAGARTLALVEHVGSLLQNSITLLAMAAIVLPYGLWLTLLLFASTLPALAVVARYSLRHHDWWQRTTPEHRRAWYYDWLLTSSETAAELRLFGLGAHFGSLYQDLRRRLRNERLSLIRTQVLAQLGATAAALLLTAATLAWMLQRALLGLVSLGDLALFYQAFSRGQGLMRALLLDAGQIYSNSLFLGNLFAFLDMASQVADPAIPVATPARLNSGISFRDVTFHYPGSDGVALRDFTLDIPAGQTVAIVGANGAGKSTLIKLLCRFFDPEAGRIELDGIDVRAFKLADLRRLITVLFQSPVQYQASAAANIAMGDPAVLPEHSRIIAAARAAGAHDRIAELPREYETQLGRWFAEGSELSGGEWQRVALARAFFRQAQVILLDEPTSFMDSWAETDWFERLRTLAAGRTVILITHRFTIAMRADIIHVMHEGQIVESGSHEQLIARGGRYAESWFEQMRASAGIVVAKSA